MDGDGADEEVGYAYTARFAGFGSPPDVGVAALPTVLSA
jgi:hypothetical protein